MNKKVSSLPLQALRSITRIFTCVLILVMGVTDSGAAQEQVRVSLNVRKASLESALLSIKKQTGYGIVYRQDQLKSTKPVTVSASNQPLEAVLALCFEGQPVSWKIVERSIIVTQPERLKRDLPEANRDKDSSLTIRGRVISVTSGESIPGATIFKIGSSKGTTTDSEGLFTLDQVKVGELLRVRSIGFRAEEILVTDSRMQEVRLAELPNALNETVIIGYGTTTRRMSTSSISSVTAKDIGNQPVSNPLAAIQGRVPGLEIVQSSGVPGSSFKVLLRGQSSLDLSRSRNDPLFVIDGVPFEAGNAPLSLVPSAANNPVSQSEGGLSPLNTISPSEIERVDVLKDADATAIYGSRGANGVILITTKKGASGSTQVSLNAYTGFSKVSRNMDMLGLQDYLAMRREAFANDGIAMNGANAPDMVLWDTTRATDFARELIGGTANSSNINLNVSGGTAKTRFRAGAGYRRETTVYSSELADKVATFSFSMNHESLSGRFRMAVSAIYGSDNNKLPSVDLTRYLNTPPNLKLYNADGSLSWSDGGVDYRNLNLTNPLSFRYSITEAQSENLSGNLNLSYALATGLYIKVNSGYNRFSSDGYSSQPTKSLDPTDSRLPSANFASRVTRSWILEPQLEWSKQFGGSKLNLLGGATLQDKTQSGLTASGENYSSDLLLTSIAAAGSITSTNSYSKYRYAALFGRASFNHKDKYLLNLSGRRDGSSRFGPGRQWANFGALGAGWVFTGERFLQNSRVISFGKLRASYGITGNDQIGDYQFLDLWRSTTGSYGGASGLYPTKMYNPDYNWEINKKMEIGLDVGFFGDKLLFTANAYRNRSSNQLIHYRLSGQTGFSTVIRNFPGLVQNEGLEFVLSAGDLSLGSVQWSGNFNISMPRNKLLRFPELESSTYASQYVIGKSLSVIQGYELVGLDPKTGIYSFVDKDGDGFVYERGDYSVFGNTDLKFSGGLQNSFRYKSWDLSFFIQFTRRLGVTYARSMGSPPPGALMNQPALVKSRWQKEGDQTEVQRFTSEFNNAVTIGYATLNLSNGGYTDASFARLRNISLSYSIPAGWQRALRIRGARIYAEGQNMLTLTGYKGPDPETQNYYVLPPLKTVAIGLQLNF